ncbi:NUDIX hydrolase [Acinetobacter larvae]|uniref:Coenzyme A pyrophosphatase n=1 Tax=Acinetobacter larvae TaxID=1789224 RepID=A0A1B2LWM0_9GAMM|nr:CoA pyrophosphatase [Acinetobacter larvae]AOA57337.1 coenzyme A pyrophosphatase [Acinetobacter larvae]
MKDRLPYTEMLQQRLRFAKRTAEAQASVLLAITDETDPKVLLTRRSLSLNQHAGEVAFPGGKRDPTDTSNVSVALREAWEETALDPFAVRLLGDLPMQKAKSGLLVKPIVGLIPPSLELMPQPTEIDRIFFASLHDLLQAQPMPHEVRFADRLLYFPSIQIENEVVWGLTARILMSLFHYGLDIEKQWPFLLNPPLHERTK